MKKYVYNFYIRWRIRRSGLFDCAYYLRHNLDVARSCMDPIRHYMLYGWKEGRKPNAFFDTNWYLRTYPDVRQSGMNPLYHYIRYGIRENRATAREPFERSVWEDGAAVPSQESQRHVVSGDVRAAFQSCREGILIIDHNLGGGANHYRNQRIEELRRQSKPVFLLHNVVSFGQECGYELTLVSGSRKEVMHFTRVQDLFGFLDTLSLEQVLYNSLVYYSELKSFLEKLYCWSKSGIQTVIAVHDFFPICPSFNLLSGEGRFCGLRSINECTSCLEKLSLDHMKKPMPIIEYKRLWHDVLSAASEILCFSTSSANLLQKAYPLLSQSKFRICPHSMDYFDLDAIELKRTRNKHLRIAMVGDIYSPAKGSGFVRDFARFLTRQDPEARIYIVGRYDGHWKNMIQTGRYERFDLGNLLAKYQIDVAMIPSIWPETFSYLTSELILLGVPLVCFDLGAQADKVRQYAYGAVIPEVSVQGAYDTITRLCRKIYDNPVVVGEAVSHEV